MIERQAALILMQDGKAGTGYIVVCRHLKTLGNGLGQSCFAGTKIAIQADHISRPGGLPKKTAKCHGGAKGWQLDGFHNRHNYGVGPASFNHQLIKNCI